MPPAIKIRDIVAARAGPGSAVKSTPAWKARLLQTAGTPAKPLGAQSGNGKELSDDSAAAGEQPLATSTGGAGTEASSEPADVDRAVPALRLTFVLPPSLPRPELARPKPPSDSLAMLRQLKQLRDDGAKLLPEELQQQQPQHHTPLAPASTGPRWASTAPMASPPPSRPSWLSDGPTATPAQQPATSALVPWGSSAAQGTPLSPSPYGGHATAAAGGAPAPLSSPCLAKLRQVEAEDTGGGFLTHYRDPQQLSGAGAAGSQLARGAAGTPFGRAITPSGTGTGVGVGGTPLSVLRSMHRLQQLQQLQREGAKLVADLGNLSVG